MFHKKWGISWFSEEPHASQETFFSMELAFFRLNYLNNLIIDYYSKNFFLWCIHNIYAWKHATSTSFIRKFIVAHPVVLHTIPFFCSTDLYRPQPRLFVTPVAFQSACMCLNVTFCSEKSKEYIYVPQKENLSVAEKKNLSTLGYVLSIVERTSTCRWQR
jgi:hypothetical protein